MKFLHLLAIIGIFLCTCAGWFILGGAVTMRTVHTGTVLDAEVTRNWGAPLTQSHPAFYYVAASASRAKKPVLPESSEVKVDLRYSPKRKGLHNYRAYTAAFDATYTIRNPTPIAQTIYGTFTLPDEKARYDAFSMKLGEKVTDKAPSSGSITESLDLPAGGSATVVIRYLANGLDTWRYEFNGAQRVRNFKLVMTTDFDDYNFPGDTASASDKREPTGNGGWLLNWDYSDVIGARAIGMDMPKLLDAGPIASRIAFYAPVSLLFYFAVLLIMTLVMNQPLHPMHWFFLAAGCFAFQLLFAYLVDLVPALPSFAISAAVSLLLVTMYLWRVAGGRFARLAALAQFAYMVLFSFSFFFDGITGLTITIGAIITLAVLMLTTARIEWSQCFASKGAQPPEIPVQASV